MEPERDHLQIKAMIFKRKKLSSPETAESASKKAAEQRSYNENPVVIPNIGSSSEVSQDPEKVPSNLSPEPEKTCPKLTVRNMTEASPMARARLYEICATKYWEPPEFVLLKEEGPNHQKMFTFKVTVKINHISSTNLECFSEPKSQKKAAQEHAAEGALWYLKNLGLLPKP